MTGSVGSRQVDPEDDTVEQVPPGQFYKDIREVMKECNISKNPKLYVLNWAKVCDKLKAKDARYASTTKEQMRSRYKYMKKLLKDS